MSVRVQFVASTQEYEQLKARAEQEGVSISKYVKDLVFTENSFGALWNEFQSKLDRFPNDIEFNVATVLGHERWEELDRSTKLSIARLFNRKVISGEYDFIKLVGRSSTNVSIYKKFKGHV